MAEFLTNTNELTSIADAIRQKGGTASGLVYPDGFVSAIDDIPSGGGSDYSPFPLSPDNANARMKLTNIDLAGQYAANIEKEYPTVDLTLLAGREITYQNLMAAILNLRIGKSATMQYDITAIFFDWRPRQNTTVEDQSTPWLTGGFFKYQRSYGGDYTVSVNNSFTVPSYTTSYDFPEIRVNMEDSTGHMYIHFLHPFDGTYNCTSLSGNYSIVNLYNIILIEKENYLY